jgi:hypothetical protein
MRGIVPYCAQKPTLLAANTAAGQDFIARLRTSKQMGGTGFWNHEIRELSFCPLRINVKSSRDPGFSPDKLIFSCTIGSRKAG